MSPRRFGSWLLAVPLVVASGLVVLLSRRLDEVSRAYGELRRLATLPHAGTVVPTFRTATLAGDSVTVGEASDSTVRQVLFVFNTTCPFCRQTVPRWQALADSLRQLGPVQVIGVSLHPADATRRYAAEHGLRFPVVGFPEPKLARLYRATAVPQTVVLDHTGTVVYAKVGLLDQPAVRDSVYRAVRGWGRDSVSAVKPVEVGKRQR